MTTTDAGTAHDIRVHSADTQRRSRLPAKRAAGYAVLFVFAVIYIYPFLIQTATSFKTDEQASADALSLRPDPFTTASWERLFDGSVPFLTWLGNSVLVTVCVTLGRVLFNSLAGYALSRLKFRGVNTIFVVILAVLAVPGVVLLIPKFLVLQSLGIWNTYTAMIVPLLVDAAGIFIMKQFFDSIPYSIEEAARIDGAGVIRIFWSIVLPMARPALITITILSFQGSWNEFTHFLVSTQSPELNTLTRGLANLTSGQLGSGNQFPLKLAAALVTTIPVAIMFVLLQRFFVTGANSGAEKG